MTRVCPEDVVVVAVLIREFVSIVVDGDELLVGKTGPSEGPDSYTSAVVVA